jgi:hypothetical protein
VVAEAAQQPAQELERAPAVTPARPQWALR